MITKIKNGIAAIAAIAALLFYGLLQKKKAQIADEHEQIAETAKDTVEQNAEAIAEGMTAEEETRNAPIDFVKRNHFS